MDKDDSLIVSDSMVLHSQLRLRWMVGFACLLTLAFSGTLFSLAVHVSNSHLHSHILLIPFICAYLIRIKWRELPQVYDSSFGWAIIAFGLGGATLVAGKVFGVGMGSSNDSLALMTLSYIFFLVGGGFQFLGRAWMAKAAFPVGFLIFMVPLPDGVVTWVENALVLASAEATHLFFGIAGTPVFREGTVFHIPGIVLRVATECSGIRSSWVLFITSLLASYLFLRSPWHRAILVALVIPLGILRNGFRIMVIGLLCVNVGPEMIESAIHKRGGPFFFGLSLIPLFLVAWCLYRREGTARTAETRRESHDYSNED